MRIRIPNFLANAWDSLGEWGDVPVFHMKGNDPNNSPYTQGEITIRRIDLLIAGGFIFCVSYYWITTGWTGALAGGALYILIAMIALWVL